MTATRVRAAPVAALALLLAATGGASWFAVYTTSSTTVGAPRLALVEYAAGANSGAGDHVASFAIGANRTTFSASFVGYGGATVTVKELVRIRNVDGAPHTVTLAGTRVANAAITKLSLEVFDGATSRGVLDLKATTPSLSLGTMPAGADWSARLVFAHAAGAGAHNGAATLSVRLEVVP